MIFDEIIERRGTNCVKYDEAPSPDVIPMWVADMDFRVAPCIIQAMQRRLDRGIFGYVHVPRAYYDSVCSWFSRRHGWAMRPEWIIYTSGVVPAISAIIKAMTQPGDKVLVQTPVYNCFFSSIRNNGCHLADSPLRRVELAPDQAGGPAFSYEVDWESFERQAADPAVKVFLLCNPHNPAGRVWSRGELLRMADICRRHDVFVISDEIHCELTMPGVDYVPFGSLGDEYLLRSAICTSPSKAFNIAGLQISNITAADPDIRRRIDRAINDNEVCDVNPFGIEALMAAYGEGEAWLDGLRSYLADNYRALLRFFAARLPQLKVCRLEGTYLVWVDCSATGMSGEELCQRALDEQRVWFNAGPLYGAESGLDYFRINIACPRQRMLQGLEALSRLLQR